MSVALASNGRAYTKPSLRIVSDNQRLCRVFHLKISNWVNHGSTSWPVNAPDTSNDLSFVYDYSDQPTSVSGKASGSYRYDGHLKRVKAVVDNKTIYNVYNIAGELVHVHELTGDKKTDYVRLGGQTVARVRGVTGGSTSANITYVYNDHLGSPVATKTGSAAIIRERYTPFGITTNNPADLDDQAGFTGHIKDKATGLNYMQARYYDPVIGRFLSIDPVTFMDTGNPSMFNRYSYANNDPVNMIDLDGREAWLVSRPLSMPLGLVANHMFVMVVNDNTGQVTRFSYGPQGRISDPGKLVNLTGSGSPTDNDDAFYGAVFLMGEGAAAQMGVAGVKINASDETVLAAGKELSDFLGTPANPNSAAPNYAALPSSTDEANSNSAASWIDNTATSRDGNGNRITNKPRGTTNPGLRDRSNISSRMVTCTGSRIKKSSC